MAKALLNKEGIAFEEINVSFSKEKEIEMIPLHRWGGELEIAKAVIALIETDFITGQTIRVDGGRHLK